MATTTASQNPEMAAAIQLALADTSDSPEFGHSMRKHFQFASDWTNLNHGPLPPSPTPSPFHPSASGLA